MRVSYSMLHAWCAGDWDRAVAMYLRRPYPSTPAMELGKKLHSDFELWGRQRMQLPIIFGSRKLNSPIFEADTKKVFALNDWIDLVGVLDVLENQTVGIDYKTGTGNVTQYTNSYQPKVYQLLYPKMTRFEFYHWNPYTRKASMSIVHLNKRTITQGAEYVLSNASELRAYLETLGLYKG